MIGPLPARRWVLPHRWGGDQRRQPWHVGGEDGQRQGGDGRGRPLRIAGPRRLVDELLGLAGLAVSWSTRLGGLAWRGLDLAAVAPWMAPGFGPERAVGLTQAYVFLQALHHAVWLSWIPQEDVHGQGTLTFAMSVRSLGQDLGGPGIAGVLLLMVGVLAGAHRDLQGTRDLYLSLVTFHVYVELAALAYFAASRRRPRLKRG